MILVDLQSEKFGAPQFADPGAVRDRLEHYSVGTPAKLQPAAQAPCPVEQLNEDAHRDASRADLISFCTRYYTERHFPKTPRKRH